MATHSRPGASRRGDIAGLGEVFGDRPWVAVYGTEDDRVEVAHPAGQNPAVAPRLLADAKHCLTCSGCSSCRRS